MVYKDNNIIIDSNIWISYFSNIDSNHTKAKNILETFSCDYQIMPDLVFYEVITVLKNKSSFENSMMFIDFIKNNKDITIQLFYEQNREVLDLSGNKEFVNLSYVDTLLLYLSKTHTIVTFDKQLIEAIDLYGGKHS